MSRRSYCDFSMRIEYVLASSAEAQKRFRVFPFRSTQVVCRLCYQPQTKQNCKGEVHLGSVMLNPLRVIVKSLSPYSHHEYTTQHGRQNMGMSRVLLNSADVAG